MSEEPGELSYEELRSAAEGDLRIWAVVMFVGSIVAVLVGLAYRALDPFNVALALASSATTSYLVWNRSPLMCRWIAFGYRLAPIMAVVSGALGIALGVGGESGGWLLLAGSVVAIPLSMVGLAILDRAEEYGVVPPHGGLF